MRDIRELKYLQSLPLERKIEMTAERIDGWYSHFDGNVAVSFSGGKDSTVLLDIARNHWRGHKLFQEYESAAKAIKREISAFYSKYAGKYGLTYDQAVRLLNRKPDETRNRIVELIGDLPRIELFARQQADGWDCWGNEVSE